MRRALLRVLAAAVLLPALSCLPSAAQDVERPVVKATWTWEGPTQHPYGVRNPELQYVSANGIETARAFTKIDLAGLTEAVERLTLTYPATDDPAVGASDPAGAAALQACPAASEWTPDPAGRPTAAGPTWDCSELSAAGTLTEGAWVFDLTVFLDGWRSGARFNDGVAIVPVTAEGTWTVVLRGQEATASAVSTGPPPEQSTGSPTTGSTPGQSSGQSPGQSPGQSSVGGSPQGGRTAGTGAPTFGSGFGQGTSGIEPGPDAPLPVAAPESPEPQGPGLGSDQGGLPPMAGAPSPVSPVASIGVPLRTVPPAGWLGLLALSGVFVRTARTLWPRGRSEEEE